MATSTISHQELQRDYASAEEAAHSGPVFITKDGVTRTVLLDIAEYRRVPAEARPSNDFRGQSLVDLLGVPEEEFFDWEPPSLRLKLSTGVNQS